MPALRRRPIKRFSISAKAPTKPGRDWANGIAFISNAPPDETPKEKTLRGTLAFAQSDPNTRATEIFINLADNAALDAQNFVPFAKVASGMEVVDKFYSGYGELMPDGKYIDPNRVENGTNAYLEPHFPKLDYIKRAVFLK